MKFFSKVIVIFYSLVIFSNSLLAKNSFEFGFSIPIGVSCGFSDQLYNDGISKNFQNETYALKLIAGPAFEYGFTLQPGYSIVIKNSNQDSTSIVSSKKLKNRDMSLSLLLDIGYKRESYGYIAYENLQSGYISGTILAKYTEKKTYTSFTFETIQVGLYPKFYIGNWAFGISGGVKIPIYFYKSNQEFEYLYDEKKYTDNLETHITGINAKKMKDVFESPVIWYIKLSADYFLYTTDKISFFVGGYLSYDFLYYFKINSQNKFVDEYFFDKYAIDALDIGAQFGIRLKSIVYSK